MTRKATRGTVKPKISLQIATAVDALKPWLQGMGSVSIVFAAILIYRGIRQPYQVLNTYNVEQMKEVFLGEDSWVVLCQDESKVVPPFFISTAKENAIDASFGVLDCSGSLPSGTNVFGKFSIDASIKPTIFVRVPKMIPKQASSSNVRTEKSFKKWLQDTLESRSFTVKSTKELKERCLEKNWCLLILKSGPIDDLDKDSIRKAMVLHRSTQFVSLDGSKYELSVEKKLGYKNDGNDHVAIYFRTTQSKSASQPSKRKLKWSVDFFQGGIADLSDWMDRDAFSAKSRVIELSTSATIRKRREKVGETKSGPKAHSNEKVESSPNISKIKREEILHELQRRKKKEADKRAKMDEEGNDVIGSSELNENIYSGIIEEDIVDLD